MNRLLLLPLLALASTHVGASPQPQTALSPGDGAVLFAFSQDYPIQLNAALRVELIATIQRTDDASHPTYTVRSRRTGLASALAFEGSMPAGHYRITGLANSKVAPPQDLPEFQVQAGKVSYLGTMLMSELIDPSTNPPTDRVNWGWHAAPDAAVGRRLLAGAFPEVASSMKEVVAGWVDAPAHDAPSTGLHEVKASTGALRLSDHWGRDGFYFASQNGVVKRWRPGGPIEYMDTGSDFALESVIEPVDGTLLAGGEAGELRVSTDGGKSWADRSANLPYGVIDNLARLDDGSVAFTIAQTDKVRVFAGKAATGEWRPIAELPMHFSFWTGMGGTMPVMFYREGKLVVTLPSRKLAIIDPASGANEVLDVVGSMANVRFSGDGVLRCSCAKTLAVSPWESRDLGRTWTSSDFSRFLMLPAFRDALHGFGFQLAPFSADKAGIETTNDGGKTWQLHRVADMGVTNGTPAYSSDGNVMVMDAVQSTGYFSARALFVFSVDGGEHWQPMPSERRWVAPDSGAVPRESGR